MKKIFLLLVFLGSMIAPLNAVQPDERLADPILEQRARALSSELRCLVCQNQSIDESDADLARDLRLLVRERLQAGDSDQAVRRFLVDRYGPFILLKPLLTLETLLLWLTAPLLLLIGAIIAWRASRRRARNFPPALTEEEKRRLHHLLKE